MRKRYSLFLQGATVGGAQTEEVSFYYDLARLLPKDKVFKLYSSFDTANYGVTLCSGIEVSVNLPQSSYYAASPVTKYTKLGVGHPVFTSQVGGGAAQFKYSYSEGECSPKTIDFPLTNVNPITVQLYATSAVNLQAAYFSLNLVFEEVE